MRRASAGSTSRRWNSSRGTWTPGMCSARTRTQRLGATKLTKSTKVESTKRGRPGDGSSIACLRDLSLRALRVLCGFLFFVFSTAAAARAQEPPPELTQPVNDFANVIDPQSKQTIEALIRSLQQASGDVVIVATVPTFKPYADIREYAVKMFENHGAGVG